MALSLAVGSANLQHWIAIGGVMIDGKVRTEKDYQSKLAWAQQVLSATRPDILGLQEVYDPSVAEIFAHPAFGTKPYRCYLSGGPPQQVAIATTLELAEPILAIRELREPITITRDGLQLAFTKLSRPILKARLVHEGDVLTVFVVHLKSKIPSFGDDPTLQYPEEQLLTADLAARSLGNLVSLVRRGAEAAALRREVVWELTNTSNPVIVLGDLNDREDAVTTEMICGDAVSSTYIPPQHTPDEIATIRRRLFQTALTSAQAVQIKNTALSQLYTNIHAGNYTSIDHILLSRHFFRAPHAVDDQGLEQRYYFNYCEVSNDHLVDRESMFAPYKPMTSDHGPVFAYLKKIPKQAVTEAPAIADAERAKSPADLELR